MQKEPKKTNTKPMTDMWKRKARIEPEQDEDGLTTEDLVCVELRDLQVKIFIVYIYY